VDVRDVIFGHEFGAFSFAWVLLDEFGNVKEALQISEGVVCLALVNLAVKFAFTGAVYTSLIN
jgi:hypothetical protein